MTARQRHKLQTCSGVRPLNAACAATFDTKQRAKTSTIAGLAIMVRIGTLRCVQIRRSYEGCVMLWRSSEVGPMCLGETNVARAKRIPSVSGKGYPGAAHAYTLHRSSTAFATRSTVL